MGGGWEDGWKDGWGRLKGRTLGEALGPGHCSVLPQAGGPSAAEALCRPGGGLVDSLPGLLPTRMRAPSPPPCVTVMQTPARWIWKWSPRRAAAPRRPPCSPPTRRATARCALLQQRWGCAMGRAGAAPALCAHGTARLAMQHCLSTGQGGWAEACWPDACSRFSCLRVAHQPNMAGRAAFGRRFRAVACCGGTLGRGKGVGGCPRVCGAEGRRDGGFAIGGGGGSVHSGHAGVQCSVWSLCQSKPPPNPAACRQARHRRAVLKFLQQPVALILPAFQTAGRRDTDAEQAVEVGGCGVTRW